MEDAFINNLSKYWDGMINGIDYCTVAWCQRKGAECAVLKQWINEIAHLEMTELQL